MRSSQLSPERAGRARGAATRALAACAGALLIAAAARAGGAAAVAAPPAPRLDLDAFEATKQALALSDGIRLAYVSMGPREGPAVVLIHGYTDSARDWVPLVPYLSPALRLILVDLRGHGRSSRPECCYTRPDFAYDVKLLLDALGIARADLVGHSLGGFITQVFAETWPERTRRVVLISSGAGVRAGRSHVAARLDVAAQIGALKEPLDPDSPFMIEWWSSPTPVDPEFVRRQRRDAAAMPLSIWRAVLDQSLSDAGDLQRTLPRLTAPTLLIWGGADPFVGEDVRATLREGLPHADVRIFPGLGHNPFWEDPRTCAAAINEFLLGGAPAP